MKDLEFYYKKLSNGSYNTVHDSTQVWHMYNHTIYTSILILDKCYKSGEMCHARDNVHAWMIMLQV